MEQITLVGKSLKTWVIYMLVVPHAFLFKISGLRMWEVKNLYFEVFIQLTSPDLCSLGLVLCKTFN